jgi:hypothetical protein
VGQVVPLDDAPRLVVRSTVPLFALPCAMPLPALAWPKRAGFAEYATPSASMTLIARLMSGSTGGTAVERVKNNPVPEPKVSVPVPSPVATITGSVPVVMPLASRVPLAAV